jgi:hypothetical protein
MHKSFSNKEHFIDKNNDPERRFCISNGLEPLKDKEGKYKGCKNFKDGLIKCTNNGLVPDKINGVLKIGDDDNIVCINTDRVSKCKEFGVYDNNNSMTYDSKNKKCVS